MISRILVSTALAVFVFPPVAYGFQNTPYAYENGRDSAPFFCVIIAIAVIAFIVWIVKKSRNDRPYDNTSDIDESRESDPWGG